MPAATNTDHIRTSIMRPLQTIGHHAPQIMIGLVTVTVVCSVIGLWYSANVLAALYLLIVVPGGVLVLAGKRAHRGSMCWRDRPSGREPTARERRAAYRYRSRRALHIGNTGGVVMVLAALLATQPFQPEHTAFKAALTVALFVGGFLSARLDYDALVYQRMVARRQGGAIGGS